MPTIMSHAAVPIAGALVLGHGRLTTAVVATGIVLAMLPDLDVIGFGMGIEYGEAWGHRGASHSLLVAAICGLLAAALLRPAHFKTVALYLFTCMASHGILDAFTNGGLGAALLWPFDDARYFAPYRPVEVSPIGNSFFTGRGLAVLWSEFFTIWLPLAGFVVLVLAMKRVLARQE
ncbi:metal-dependent hydrolase [Sphingorhabdus sp. Alg239-R122]|uniref:metal-dependent hydrolase n=1 Tax=Sphingorhabdus sp. Alg239-R122 TaxID=2305989 RepID=UPI0013D9EC0D|nr:metal-dependent hydrolase [Sphingorhabdus sp. Alg239-R122]